MLGVPAKAHSQALLTGAERPVHGTPLGARIDALLAPRIATREANGAVVVLRDGREIYRRHIGFADWEHDVPVVPGTVFRVASVSKTVTAAAILQLERTEKLNLDDPVARYLPSYPGGEEITIRHLLSHRSGLGEVPSPEDPAGTPDLDAVIATFSDLPLAFEPGTGNRYSGAGYVLLAKIVEVVSGEPYREYLRSKIFAPLGMTASGHFSLRDLVPNRARGYLPAAGDQRVVNVRLEELASYLGEGSLQTSVDDLVRWVEAIRTGAVVDLSSQQYPYGWGVRNHFGRPSWEQTGLQRGFAASAVIYPKERLSIVCLFNVQTGFFNSCGTQIAAIVLGEKPVSAVPAMHGDPVALDQAGTRDKVGTYRARPDLAMEIDWVFDGLHFRWVGDATWQYLIPMEGERFYAPSESAILTFHRGANGTSVRWQSSFDALHFAPDDRAPDG